MLSILKIRFILLLIGLLMGLALLPAHTVVADSSKQLSPAIRSQVARAAELVEQNKPDEAIRIYNNIIAARPQLLFAYNNLAVIYARQGKLEEAAATLKKGIASDPEFASLYNNLTNIYLELSRKDYGKALRLDDKPGQLALQTMSPSAEVATHNQIQGNQAGPTKHAATTADNDKDELLLMVEGWAGAWSAQDTDKYLSYYASDFVPGKGLSHSAWTRQRRQRIERPRWLEVTLSEIKLKKLTDDRVQVSFFQHYRSDNYEDKTRKLLTLRQTQQGWKIMQEKSL